MVAKPNAKRKAAEIDPEYEAAIEKARTEVDAGRTVSYDKVRRWLLSWGSDKELPRPRCK